MSYRCSICDQPVVHNQPLRRHIIKRCDGQIASEISVCLDCHAGLRSGYSLDQMIAICGPKHTVPVALVVPPTPQPVTFKQES